MKRYIKVLFIQLVFICAVSFIIEMFWGLPDILGVVIAAALFGIMTLYIQIHTSVVKMDNTISGDGIAGTRLGGVFFNSVLLQLNMRIFLPPNTKFAKFVTSNFNNLHWMFTL